MDNRDIDAIAGYIEKTAQKEANKSAAQTASLIGVIQTQGGLQPVSSSKTTGAKSLLYNGGFENSLDFDMNPLGWRFQNSLGIVQDFRYQPSSADANYEPDQNTTTPTPGLAIPDWVTGATIINADKESGVFYGYDFEGDVIDPITGSNKFLMLQDAQTRVVPDDFVGDPNQQEYIDTLPEYTTADLMPSRVSEFSMSQHIPEGVLSEGELYYLDFQVGLWDGFVDAPQNASYADPSFLESSLMSGVQPSPDTMIHQPTWKFASGKVDSDSKPFATLRSNTSDVVPTASIVPTVIFYDTELTVVATFMGAPLSPGLNAGWYRSTLAFMVPDGAASADIKFVANTNAHLFDDNVD